MTRLNTSDIDGISNRLYNYDLELKNKYGYTLKQIAIRAVTKSNNQLTNKINNYKIAVIPVTSGMGIISGFSETVCDILKYCNLNVFVTNNTDVAGLQEAYKKEADIVFMADDDVCSAFSIKDNVYSDNGYATGISFAAALEIMMDSVTNQEVLILGAGPVGIEASKYFSRIGAVPVICDLQEEKAINAANEIANAKVERNLNNINKYLYILDATTSFEFIKETDVTERTKISAPGIPLGVTEGVIKKADVFHNPLELGIITMYYDCINKARSKK